MKLSRKQFEALALLKTAIAKATETALFDTLTVYAHPKIINDFVDAVDLLSDDLLVPR